MTKKTDYPSPKARYEAALEEVEAKLQSGELRANSTPFKRRAVDIPALRERYGMTQQQFADAFGVAIGTLRNWEQGRRIPDGPAQCLLQIIEDRPDVASDVLGSHDLRQKPPSADDIRRRAAELRRRAPQARAARDQSDLEELAEEIAQARSGLFAINKLIYHVARSVPASSLESQAALDEDIDNGQEPPLKRGEAS